MRKSKLKKISQAKLKEFAKLNAWEYKMRESRVLDSFDNYGGENLGNLVVVSVGRNRDSEIMSESNFDTALTMLGGVSKHVTIERFGHWGCGWFELILVNPKHKKSLEIAYRIKESLDNYPILDEDDFCERENKYQSEFAKDTQVETAKALAEHFGLKYSNKLKNIAYSLQMSMQQYAGNDACLNIHKGRKPDKRDVEYLRIQLKNVEYCYETSKLFKRLKTAVESYKVQEAA